MAKLKIIFCNNWNVGDIFFAKPFIENVVKMNGDRFEYYIWIKYSFFLFSDIQNLKNVNDFPDLIEKLGDMSAYNKRNFILSDQDNILLINTWIGTMNYKGHDDERTRELFGDYLKECDVVSYLNGYRRIIDRIQFDHGIQINYDFDPILAFPSFPTNVPIDKFERFKSEKMEGNQKCVFLNNYLPKSGQSISLRTSNELLFVVDYIRSKGYIVILPEEDDLVISYINTYNINDVYFCSNFLDNSIDDFNSSSELYYRAKICVTCDFSIYFDTGRNFLYLNRDFLDDFKQMRTKNIKIHFSTSTFDFYFKNLSSDKTVVPVDYATQYIAEGANEVIQHLSNLL